MSSTLHAPDSAFSKTLDLETVRDLVADDMRAVNQQIEARLRSDVNLINQVGAYIVNSGGKRLRPLLVLLSARASGCEGRDYIDLAAVVEFIHTATLLHDDVVDASALRRGRDTANAVWGNEASVLVGDFLYSRAFQMMVQVRNMQIMEILADTTNVIAEGEVMQLINCHDPDTTEEQYLNIIRSKTAKLFEAAARIGPVLTNRPPAEEDAMAAYGRHIGTAYQLVDDVLDYSGSTADIGKNVGDDLAEGKPTLPLIHALRRGTESQATVIRETIRNGGRKTIHEILEAIESTNAIAYTARAARREADLAIAALEEIAESPYKEAMYALAEFCVDRRY
jgi:octaprenyl-diphosphate synthase